MPVLEQLENSPAIFSRCRRYRYALRRTWSPLFADDFTLFIGLNPSTADETFDDPTIRRCIAFSKAWGSAGLVMANLFAWRDTLPANMKRTSEPVGEENDRWLAELAAHASRIVCAWGKHGGHLDRAAQVCAVLAGRPLFTLGHNLDGSPRHPLYVPSETQLVTFRP